MNDGIPTPPPGTTANGDEALRLRTGFLRLKSALHDPITGLYAYHVHTDQLNMASDGRAVAVIVLDFPSLAQIEAAHGWEMSDRFLSGVAAFLGAFRRHGLPTSSIISLDAVHGTSFLIFLHETMGGVEVRDPDLADLAARLAHHLDARMAAAEWALAGPHVDFSVGFAFVNPSPAARFERRVHQAISEARAMALRQTDRRLDARAAELLCILQEARVTTHYQPIVDMQQGIIMGYEALTRGPSNSTFEVPEALFSFSNSAQMLFEVDMLCRHQALRNARGFDPKKKLFLNAHPETLGAPGYADGGFLQTLEEVPLLPRNLVLEITERAAIHDFEAFGHTIAPLRQQGFLVAIDDVGTGYSSLQTISEIQPDYLKVDISLIKNIHRSLIKQELVRSLLQIAARIGARVIAEGVESEEEYRALRRCGVRFGQGFFFAPPAPPFAALDRGASPDGTGRGHPGGEEAL